jgi:hypothetical protein
LRIRKIVDLAEVCTKKRRSSKEAGRKSTKLPATRQGRQRRPSQGRDLKSKPLQKQASRENTPPQE